LAATICQHQARGADKITTNSVDARVEAERKRKDLPCFAVPTGTYPGTP
jgi:hypothetical protein